MIDRITYEDKVSMNEKIDVTSGKPIVAFCPDWIVEEDGKSYLSTNTLRFHTDAFESYGAQMLLLSYNDTVDSVKYPVDGWMIPGGRDLDPKFYGQENKGSKVTPADSERRWNFCKHWIEKADPKMPIFGICFGMQIMNCLFRGTLVQDIPTMKYHMRMRRMNYTKGSFLDKALGGTDRILLGNCSHHQIIDRLAEGFEVVCWDDKDNQPHAMEYKKDDRMILCMQWHPEYSYRDARLDSLDPANELLFKYFFDHCVEYRKNKNNEKILANEKLVPN